MTVLGSKFSRQLFENLQAADTLANVAAFANVDTDATLDGYGDEITAQLISGNFFQTVGVTAAAGRTIIPSDDVPSAEPAVVVSYGFWSRRFSRDPTAIGKRVFLNGVLTATIVGVLPADFHVGRGVVPDFSIPFAFEKQLAAGLLAPENWGLSIVAGDPRRFAWIDRPCAPCVSGRNGGCAAGWRRSPPSLGLMSIGLVLGLGLSQLVSFAIRPFVYGVPSYDPRTLSFSIAILLGVAVVAGYLPARRATLVDPTIALRHE